MIDHFRPKKDSPARFIYDELMDEVAKRDKNPDTWIENERKRVLSAASLCADAFEGLTAPRLDDVIRAENLALGHTDYASKWVYSLLDKMRS